MATLITTLTGSLVSVGECTECKIEWAIPDWFLKAKQCDHQTFYCPNGHRQYYPAGKTEAEKLRDELKRSQDLLARREAQLNAETLSHRATKGKVTKLRKRIENGVCPECHRHFPNLEAHMSTQHLPARAK